MFHIEFFYLNNSTTLSPFSGILINLQWNATRLQVYF